MARRMNICECCISKFQPPKRDSSVASRLCPKCWRQMTRFFFRHGLQGQTNPRPHGWQNGHVDAWLTFKEAQSVR